MSRRCIGYVLDHETIALLTRPLPYRLFPRRPCRGRPRPNDVLCPFHRYKASGRPTGWRAALPPGDPDRFGWGYTAADIAYDAKVAEIWDLGRAVAQKLELDPPPA